MTVRECAAGSWGKFATCRQSNRQVKNLPHEAAAESRTLISKEFRCWRGGLAHEGALSSKLLVLKPFAVERQGHARHAGRVFHFADVYGHINGAHDAVAEQLVGHVLEYRTVEH